MAISISVSIRSIDGTVRIQWVSVRPRAIYFIEFWSIGSVASDDRSKLQQNQCRYRCQPVIFHSTTNKSVPKLEQFDVIKHHPTNCHWILCQALMADGKADFDYISFFRCRYFVHGASSLLPLIAAFRWCFFYVLNFPCAPAFLLLSYATRV